MPSNSVTDNRWNIRFGQILRSRLDALEQADPNQFNTRLQDCFYFHTADAEFFAKPVAAGEALKALDLNSHVDAYRKHFTPAKAAAIAPLSEKTAAAFDTTVIIVPHQGHEGFAPAPALHDAAENLRAAHFDIRYASYENSLKSPAAAGKALLEWLEQQTELKPQIVFVAYATGVRVAAELFALRGFEAFRPATRALVSLAGALQCGESELPRAAAVNEMLTLLRRVAGRAEGPLEAQIVRRLKEIITADVEWSSGILEIIQQVEACAPHLTAPGEDFASALEMPPWLWPEDADATVPLFSLSALQPRASLKGQATFPKNIDDLFLYLISQPLAGAVGELNDAVLGVAETRFPARLPNPIVHLATVHTDHWGLVFPRVLCLNEEDPFPRTALLEALILTLIEYFT